MQKGVCKCHNCKKIIDSSNAISFKAKKYCIDCVPAEYYASKESTEESKKSKKAKKTKEEENKTEEVKDTNKSKKSKVDGQSKEDENPQKEKGPKRSRKTKIKEEKTPEEVKNSEDYKALSTYMFENFCNKEQYLLKPLLSQVKKLVNEEDVNYTYSGILDTLKYVYSLSDNPPIFNHRYGITSTVIFYYYRAAKYYNHVEELKKQDINKIDNILQASGKEIHINQNVVNYQRKLFEDRRKDKLYGPLIDLNSIEDIEDIEDIEEWENNHEW